MTEQVSTANEVLAGELPSVPAHVEHRRSLLNVQEPIRAAFLLLTFLWPRKEK